MVDDELDSVGDKVPTAGSATPDIVDDEELDVVIERVAPRRGSGGAWVVIVLVLAVILLAVGLYVRGQNLKAAAKEREDRESAYAVQTSIVTNTLTKAAGLAEKGQLDAAVELVNAASDKWAAMAGDANGARDVERAEQFAGKQADLKKIGQELGADRQKVAALDRQIQDLTKQREAVYGAVRDRIMGMSGMTSGSGSASKTEAAPEPGQPAAENQVQPEQSK